MKPIFCLALVNEDGSVFIDSTVKNEQSLSALGKQGSKFQIVRVKVSEHVKRSLDASALFHVWVNTISGHTGEDTATTKQLLKIKFGFPIVFQCEEKGPQLKWILEKLCWSSMDYNQQIKLCDRWIPITSIMETRELKAMMDNIKDWAMNEYNIQLDNGKR